MAKKERGHVADLRGASRLAIEATQGVTALVEEMHRTIAAGPALIGRPLDGPARLMTGLVYGGIRGVTGLVGAGIDRALAELTPLLGESQPGPEREAVLAALNGVLGDYLAETGNPLATEMQLRHDGEPGRRLLLLVHGSCMHGRQWRRSGHDHGEVLARDLGFTPVYLTYNSGRHISTNGRDLAHLLDTFVAAWPEPLDEVAILAHSMGGLVSRSACRAAEVADLRWRKKLSAQVFLGTPHHGAPLERGGNWVDVLLGATRYSAPLARLGKIRSAGVTDLRHGNVLDEHWHGRDRFAKSDDRPSPLPLPSGVACYAAAGNLGLGGSDGLVPVDSALGKHARPEQRLAFPEAHQWTGAGVGHLDLLDRAEVYETVRSWLASVSAHRTTSAGTP